MNFDCKSLRLIIGLGNPTQEYQNTYHSVGLAMIDYLSQKVGISKWRRPLFKKFEYLKTDDWILVKSLNFMNESGQAVKEALKFFKVKPEEILIIHDDSDIILGNYRLIFERGSAGHKGIESIIKTLKTKKFWRLRIGIRIPNSKTKAEALVLKQIPPRTQQILQKVFHQISLILIH